MEAREALGHPHAREHVRRAACRCWTAGGKVLDTALPVRFGFREFWIDGRDFYLNGTRIFLSAVPLDNAQVGAAWATYEGAKESLLRLKSFGINFVYTHNYGCEPGTHLSFAEILRAADDVGMLVSLSQPHFGHYDWKAADADRDQRLRPPRRVLRPRGREPSVGRLLLHEPQRHRLRRGHEPGHDRRPPRPARPVVGRTTPSWPCGPRRSSSASTPAASSITTPRATWARCTRATSTRTSPRSRSCPTGSSTGPPRASSRVFTCEYGAPFTWDWTMYRGWYKGKRDVRQRRGAVGVLLRRVERAVPRRPGLPDQRAGEGEPALGGQAVPRRQRSGTAGIIRTRSARTVFDDQHTVIGHVHHRQLAGLPHLGRVGQLAVGVRPLLAARATAWTRAARRCTVDWENLQRPGFSPDYIERAVRADGPGLRACRLGRPRPTAQALLRNNLPLLAYIAGKAARASRARTTTSCPARRSRSSSSSSTTRGETGRVRLLVVARPAAGRWRAQEGQREDRRAGAACR